MILYNVLEVAGYRGIIPYRYNVSRKVAAMLASIARHFVAAGGGSSDDLKMETACCF